MKKPKPKLPKKWKRQYGTQRAELSAPIVLCVLTGAYGGECIELRIGTAPSVIAVGIETFGKDGTRLHNIRRLVRAVELAAIHAGLVEDRDP